MNNISLFVIKSEFCFRCSKHWFHDYFFKKGKDKISGGGDAPNILKVRFWYDPFSEGNRDCTINY